MNFHASFKLETSFFFFNQQSDNGLLPARFQGIIWINHGLMLIISLGAMHTLNIVSLYYPEHRFPAMMAMKNPSHLL